MTFGTLAMRLRWLVFIVLSVQVHTHFEKPAEGMIFIRQVLCEKKIKSMKNISK